MIRFTPNAIKRLFTDLLGEEPSLGGAMLNGALVGLYQGVNNPSLAEMTDLIVCDYSGFAEQALAVGDSRDFQNGELGRTAELSFEGVVADPQVANTVRGWYITTDDGMLVCYDEFPEDDRPTLSTDATQLPLVINLKIDSLADFGDTVRG